MKLNKTLIIAALAVGSLFAGNVVQAQDSTNTPPAGGQGMRGRGMNVDNIATQLGLTDDQKTKITPIIQDMQKQMTDLRSDSSLSQEDRRAKMKDIRDGASAKLKDILTPEQYAKWEKMAARGRRPAPGANSPSTNAPAQ